MNKRLIAIFAATLMLATGCASVPMADTSADTTAKTFKVAPNKSGIYIYRNESMGAAVSMDLFINGKPLDEPYPVRPLLWRLPAVQLGPNDYWVMGDNRISSMLGAVPRDHIVGKAMF